MGSSDSSTFSPFSLSVVLPYSFCLKPINTVLARASKTRQQDKASGAHNIYRDSQPSQAKERRGRRQPVCRGQDRRWRCEGRRGSGRGGRCRFLFQRRSSQGRPTGYSCP
ncbi:hypothetical protein COP1_000939 [Malus domestica]